MKKNLVAALVALLSAYSVFAGGIYRVITSTSDFATGDSIILVSYDTEKNMYVMGTYDDETGNVFHAINIGTTTATYLPETITLGSVNESGYPYEYEVTMSSTNVRLKSGTKYVYADEKKTNTNLTLSSSYAWKPIIFQNSNFGFGAVSLQRGTISLSIGYVYSSSSFCKKNTGGTSGYMLAYCYKKVGTKETVTTGSAGRATLYYEDNDVKLADGLTGYTLDVSETVGEVYVLSPTHTFAGGDVVPKGTAVLVSGTANTTYDVSVLTEAASTADPVDAVNVLYGETDGSGYASAGDGVYYKLTDGVNGNGFYWGNADGAAFAMPAHRAYLYLPSGFGDAKWLKVTLDDNTATGVGSMTENANRGKYSPGSWNLLGQGTRAGSKGITIGRGRKVLQK